MRSTWWRRNSNKLALIFIVSGLLVAASTTVFSVSRSILPIVFWTFFFAAVLLYFLSPERRIRATVSELVYAELAANEAELVEAYGLQNVQIYLPQSGLNNAATDDSPARLFVPRHAEFDLPEEDELTSLFVASNAEWQRGLSFRPTGNGLFREFVSMLKGEMSDSPSELAEQLADGLTEGLELADRVTPAVQPARWRVDFEIANSQYGSIDRFDHPVQSFLAIGLAVGLDRPVLVETTTADTDRFDYVVTCRWRTDDQASDAQQVRGSGSVPLWPGGWESKSERTGRRSESPSKRTVERNELPIGDSYSRGASISRLTRTLRTTPMGVTRGFAGQQWIRSRRNRVR